MKKLTSLLLSAVFSAGLLCTSGTLPASAAEEPLILGVNAINVTGGEGHAVLYTPAHGESVKAGTDFAWWRTATFEYSDELGAYVVVSVSLTAGGSSPKSPFIPEDGFVLCANVGNDYSASGGINYVNALSTDTYNAIASLNIGDAAYLTGIDLAAGTIDTTGSPYYGDGFVSNAKITVGAKPDGDVYTPDRSAGALPQVVTDIGGNRTVDATADFTFTWEPVEGADGYIVNINDCTITGDGPAVAANVRTQETGYTIPAGRLTVGGSYSVCVSAYGEGKLNSFNSRDSLFAVSAQAAESPFRDKTIVAFGDSITAFTGWVKMLSGRLGTNVVNSGVGGDNTSQGLARFETDVAAYEPDIVIILFGMNDQAEVMSTGKPILDPETYAANYREIIGRCVALGAQPVLLTGHNVCTESGYYTPGGYGLDYSTENLNDYYDISRSLAAEYGLNLIDLNALCAGEKDTDLLAKGDGIHLSTYGHEKYAEWIGDYMLGEFEWKDLSAQEPQESSSPADESGSEASSEPAEPSAAESAAASEPEKRGLSGGAIAAIAAAAVVLVGGIAFFAAKRKKK